MASLWMRVISEAIYGVGRHGSFLSKRVTRICMTLTLIIASR
jgi:hypothetical protein